MNASGARLDRPSPEVLRLLPHVQPPPAKVLVVGGSGHEARALDARGYDVTVLDTSGGDGVLPVLEVELGATDFGGRFDLVCQAASPRVPTAAHVAAAARALRPGGQLFGAFPSDASALLHVVSPHFDVVRSVPVGDVLEVVLRRR